MKRIIFVSVGAILTFILLVMIFVPPSRQQGQWGQGRETATGYYEPDHGYFYYWMMYNVLFSNPQPTYHIYVAPSGYPPSYRPWQPAPAPRAPIASTPTATTSPRTSGGFAPTPTTTSPRTTGGFAPAPSQPSAPASMPRSSGGFSSSRPSSGGFSSPRSSGGFSGKR